MLRLRDTDRGKWRSSAVRVRHERTFRTGVKDQRPLRDKRGGRGLACAAGGSSRSAPVTVAIHISSSSVAVDFTIGDFSALSLRRTCATSCGSAFPGRSQSLWTVWRREGGPRDQESEYASSWGGTELATRASTDRWVGPVSGKTRSARVAQVLPHSSRPKRFTDSESTPRSKTKYGSRLSRAPNDSIRRPQQARPRPTALSRERPLVLDPGATYVRAGADRELRTSPDRYPEVGAIDAYRAGWGSSPPLGGFC